MWRIQVVQLLIEQPASPFRKPGHHPHQRSGAMPWRATAGRRSKSQDLRRLPGNKRRQHHGPSSRGETQHDRMAHPRLHQWASARRYPRRASMAAPGGRSTAACSTVSPACPPPLGTDRQSEMRRRASTPNRTDGAERIGAGHQLSGPVAYDAVWLSPLTLHTVQAPAPDHTDSLKTVSGVAATEAEGEKRCPPCGKRLPPSRTAASSR